MTSAIRAEDAGFRHKERFAALFSYGEGKCELGDARHFECQIVFTAFYSMETEICFPELPHQPIDQCFTRLMLKQCKFMKAKRWGDGAFPSPQRCERAHWHFAQCNHAAEKRIRFGPVIHCCLQDSLRRSADIAAMHFAEIIVRQIFIDQLHEQDLNCCTANSHLVHAQMRLANADRHPLSALAAIA